MNECTAAGNAVALTSTDRTRNFRARLAGNDCARLEVALGRDVIRQARAFAKQKGQPMWQVVEDALQAYLDSAGNDNHSFQQRKAP